MKDMKLYRFTVVKNGRQYNNYVLSWSHNKKVWRMYVRPSFLKDFKIACGVAVQVNSYKECK